MHELWWATECPSLAPHPLFQKEKKNLNDFEGIYVAQDLDVPDAQRIIDLENLKGKFKSAHPSSTAQLRSLMSPTLTLE